jgi:hypothetical protein
MKRVLAVLGWIGIGIVGLILAGLYTNPGVR